MDWRTKHSILILLTWLSTLDIYPISKETNVLTRKTVLMRETHMKLMLNGKVICQYTNRLIEGLMFTSSSTTVAIDRNRFADRSRLNHFEC